MKLAPFLCGFIGMTLIFAIIVGLVLLAPRFGISLTQDTLSFAAGCVCFVAVFVVVAAITIGRVQ